MSFGQPNAFGGGLAKGGTATLSINDQKVAEGRIEHTVPFVFSGDAGADVGVDSELQFGTRRGGSYAK